MEVNFFEKELIKVREKFNQTFGKQFVCDLQTRAHVIISIIHMGLLGNKILKAKDKELVRDDIQMFIKIRNALATMFSNVDKYFEERRRYDKGNQANRRPSQRSNVG